MLGVTGQLHRRGSRLSKAGMGKLQPKGPLSFSIQPTELEQIIFGIIKLLNSCISTIFNVVSHFNKEPHFVVL